MIRRSSYHLNGTLRHFILKLRNPLNSRQVNHMTVTRRDAFILTGLRLPFAFIVGFTER